MRAHDDMDRVQALRELTCLADSTSPGWSPEGRRRRWTPARLPSVKVKVASCAGVALTLSFGAALWSAAPAAAQRPASPTPVAGARSPGAVAGAWLVSTGRPVNVFACQEEYLRSVRTATVSPTTRVSFVSDCVRAADRTRV